MPAVENAKKQAESLQAGDLIVHGVVGNFQHALVGVGLALDQDPRQVPAILPKSMVAGSSSSV